MADFVVRRRIPPLFRLYVYFRMFRNAYRVTSRGLRHPVAPGDVINLEIRTTVRIDGTAKASMYG